MLGGRQSRPPNHIMWIPIDPVASAAVALTFRAAIVNIIGLREARLQLNEVVTIFGRNTREKIKGGAYGFDRHDGHSLN